MTIQNYDSEIEKTAHPENFDHDCHASPEDGCICQDYSPEPDPDFYLENGMAEDFPGEAVIQ